MEDMLNNLLKEREVLEQKLHGFLVKRVREICDKYGCTFDSGMEGCWINRNFTYYEIDESEPSVKELNIIDYTDYYYRKSEGTGVEHIIEVYNFTENDLLRQLFAEVEELWSIQKKFMREGFRNHLGDMTLGDNV